MADNVYTLFPTYLPIGRLVTHNKHNKQRFKHQTFNHNNKTHNCKVNGFSWEGESIQCGIDLVGMRIVSVVQ